MDTIFEKIEMIKALTLVIQPKENNISFSTQNKAQVILADLISEVANLLK